MSEQNRSKLRTAARRDLSLLLASELRAGRALGAASIGGLTLELLLQSLAEPAEVSGLDGRILLANPAFLEGVDRSMDQLVGTPSLTRALPGVASGANEVRCGRCWSGEVEWLGRGWTLYLSPLVDAQGEPSACVALLRSRSAKRDLDEPVSGVPTSYVGISDVPASLLWVDEEGRILDVSDRWSATTGYPRDEVLGLSADAFLQPVSESDSASGFWQQAPFRGRWFRCLNRDGVWSLVTLDASVRRSAGGQTVFGVLREVGQSIPPGASVPPGNTAESQRLASLGRIAGGVAHDVGNMLTVITNSAALARRRLEQPELADAALKRVQEAAERSAELASQLLAFSKGQEATREPLDLNALLLDFRGMIESLVGDSVEFRLDLEHGLEAINGARSQVEQALINLATNARDAMPQGGQFTVITRSVTVREQDGRLSPPVPAGCYVVLEAADSGVGMPSNVVERVLEPFFTTKASTRGNGIGLSIVQGVMDQLGGHLRLQSCVGQGSTFMLYFPAVASTSKIPVRPEQSYTVLVVDDEAPVRRAVAKMISATGFQVATARDGEDALNVLGSQHVDLVLTDVVMPRMSGAVLAEHIQERHPQVRILFMSGYAHEVITERGLDLENLVLLQKPFTRVELLRKLQAALGSVTLGAHQG